MGSITAVSRRQFIVTGAGAAGVLALNPEIGFSGVARAQEAKPLPSYVAWKNPQAMIVHSSNTLETKRDFYGIGGITPSNELFVRNNLSSPSEEIVAKPDAWEVKFDGVKKPRSMKLSELRNLGLETVVAVLQCSGNGRGYFTHKASGSQWKIGACGNVMWSGVPLRDVVKALGGVSDGRKFITSTGGETLPDKVDPKTVVVERSVPLSVLDTAILAWDMNGAPVPVAHGGPLRLIVPGYYGVNNIKYVKQIAFTDKETDVNIQKSGYRMRPVGQKGAPDQPSMWGMSIKSWVTHPLKESEKGPVQIYGVAFGGTNAVKSVEVTVDGGKTWKAARFVGPDLGRYAWRTFVLSADLKPGSYMIASRATDTKGVKQPENYEENERGYGHNGWKSPAVDVTIA
jgi:DMSO/TMAO reductase YedYZ molybdopterin-dependent catalytic subunit